MDHAAPPKPEPNVPRSAAKRRPWPQLLLVMWAAPLVLIGAVLMAGHWSTLPKPDRGDRAFHNAMTDLTAPGAGHWQLVHVLYTECRCSQRLFEYLFHREAPGDVVETVVLVGDPRAHAAQARAAGYRVEVIEREALKARFAIESAPLLIIANPEQELPYVGGYTGRKQGADYRDLDILTALRGGRGADDLPLYGCGVSRELQAFLDPIGVKYDDG